jgi:Bacterial Ig-like domain (group 3)
MKSRGHRALLFFLATFITVWFLSGCGGGSAGSTNTSSSTGAGGGGGSSTTPAATTTTLASSLSTVTSGTSVTFTATVTSAGGTPTGTVNFTQGTSMLGSATLNSSGVATYSTDSLAVGSDSVAAAYVGNSNFAASTSTAVKVSVTAPSNPATNTALTASAPTISAGSTETFTATVTPVSGSGTPTGTVTFNDSSNALGTSALSGGTATYTTASLQTGVHSITAAYSGSGSFTASTSNAVSVTVTAASSTQFCGQINYSVFNNPDGSPQTACGLGTVTVTSPVSNEDYFGVLNGGVCDLDGWPADQLNGFTCTWPNPMVVTFNQPVISTQLVSLTHNSQQPLGPCTQTGVGNLQVTIANPDNSATGGGEITIQQVTSTYTTAGTLPGNCSVIAFNVNGNAVLVNVGLQIWGGSIPDAAGRRNGRLEQAP